MESFLLSFTEKKRGTTMSQDSGLEFDAFVTAVQTYDLEAVGARDTAHSSAVSVKPWQHVEKHAAEGATEN